MIYSTSVYITMVFGGKPVFWQFSFFVILSTTLAVAAAESDDLKVVITGNLTYEVRERAEFKCTGNNTDECEFTWSSSNIEIASLMKTNGPVFSIESISTDMNGGDVICKIKEQERSGTEKIILTVLNEKILNVTIEGNQTYKVEQRAEFKCKLINTKQNPTFTWKSLNPELAELMENVTGPDFVIPVVSHKMDGADVTCTIKGPGYSGSDQIVLTVEQESGVSTGSKFGHNILYILFTVVVIISLSMIHRLIMQP